MTRTGKLLLAYGVPLTFLTLFYWVASDGHRLDGSPIRGLLYWTFFLILPLGYASFAVHCLPLVLCTRRQRARARAISLVGGLVAPIILVVSMAASDDGEAWIAVIAVPLVYCGGVIVGALATSLTMKAMTRWSRHRP